VLIPLSLIFVCVQLIKKSNVHMTVILIIVTACSGWLSVVTGNWEDAEVGSTLCDPTVLKSHENFSNNAMIIYSVAAGMYVLSLIRFQRLLQWLCALLILSSTALMLYSAHLGGKLVYEQAAGVNVPAKDCRGF
jgi:hypothetical protein